MSEEVEGLVKARLDKVKEIENLEIEIKSLKEDKKLLESDLRQIDAKFKDQLGLD